MWSFLPMVENKKRRAGFHIRPQRCSQMHNILAERSDANHRIYYFLFIIYYL